MGSLGADGGSSADTEPGTISTISGTQALSEQRALLHLKPVAASPLLTRVAQDHADYLAVNGAETDQTGELHHQNPQLPGFTGVTLQDRLTAVGYGGLAIGENVAFRPSREAALQSWMESLYARLPMVRPEATEVGFGVAGSGANRIHVLVIGSGETATSASEKTVHYPAEEQRHVAREWSGKELPQPEAPPLGYPSGPIISLHLGAGEVQTVTANLTRAPGSPVLIRVLTSQDDPFLEPRDVALIPHQPLDSGHTYEVSLSGTHTEGAFAVSWRFTTMNATCDPVTQDCGAGRACYIQSGAPLCLWVGSEPPGRSCDFMNICDRGSGCYGLGGVARCRPYCERDGGTNCGTLCPDGFTPIENTDFGFCW